MITLNLIVWGMVPKDKEGNLLVDDHMLRKLERAVQKELLAHGLRLIRQSPEQQGATLCTHRLERRREHGQKLGKRQRWLCSGTLGELCADAKHRIEGYPRGKP